MNSELPTVYKTPKCSALKLGVGEKWLRAEIKAGRVPGIQIGNRFLVDLDLYIEQLRSKEVSR